MIHACREPEEALGAKHARKRVLNQVPKLRRVERPAGTIDKDRHALITTLDAWLCVHQLPPSSTGEGGFEVERVSSVQHLRLDRIEGGPLNDARSWD